MTRERRRGPEPIPDGDLGRAPSGLTAAQQRIWRYAIRHAPSAVLKLIDADVLRSWVITIERRDRLQQILDDDYGKPDWAAHPAHYRIDHAIAQQIRLASELGFSPAARPRLRAAAAPAEDEANPWAALRVVSGGKD